MLVKGAEKKTISEYLVLAMAMLGIVATASEVIKTALGFLGSIVMLGISAFGAVWLYNLAKEQKWKSKDTIMAISLIVSGFILYNITPLIFPQTFSLIPM